MNKYALIGIFGLICTLLLTFINTGDFATKTSGVSCQETLSGEANFDLILEVCGKEIELLGSGYDNIHKEVTKLDTQLKEKIKERNSYKEKANIIRDQITKKAQERGEKMKQLGFRKSK